MIMNETNTSVQLEMHDRKRKLPYTLEGSKQLL